MKTLYFDCSSGISGNMTLGALLEIIGDDNYLLEELKKLNIDGYRIEISKKVKNGITGKYVDVILEEDDDGHEHSHAHHHEHDHNHEHEHHHEHNHEHEIEMHNNIHKDRNHEHSHEYVHKQEQEHHHHAHRNLTDVNEIIDKSSIDEKSKDLAKRIFLRVARAEAKKEDLHMDYL